MSLLLGSDHGLGPRAEGGIEERTLSVLQDPGHSAELQWMSCGYFSL